MCPSKKEAPFLSTRFTIADAIARAVKLTDLKDNIGDGIPYPPEDVWRNARLDRYRNAQATLQEVEHA